MHPKQKGCKLERSRALWGPQTLNNSNCPQATNIKQANQVTDNGLQDHLSNQWLPRCCCSIQLLFVGWTVEWMKWNFMYFKNYVSLYIAWNDCVTINIRFILLCYTLLFIHTCFRCYFISTQLEFIIYFIFNEHYFT